MEELERKRLHWQKVTAVVCILLLIVVTASSALAFVGVRRYAPRIEHIVSRLDSVTAELDALDAQRLVDTVNGLTGELEKAQLADTLDSLRTISAQLEKVDWAALGQSTGDMLAQAQKSLCRRGGSAHRRERRRGKARCGRAQYGGHGAARRHRDRSRSFSRGLNER